MAHIDRLVRFAFALAILLPPVMPANAAGSSESSKEGTVAAAAALDKGDFATARRILEPLAGSGDTDAQVLLGLMYLVGDGGIQDPREAARLFRLSADHGNKQGKFQLARLLLQGTGVEKDEVQAFRYFEMSASQGFDPAQLALGVLLSPAEFEYQGVVVGAAGALGGVPSTQRIPKDAVAAAHYYRLAAEQGNAVAQFNLGLANEQGLGVPLNLVEAVRLYRLAAKQGHSGAQNNLGAKYNNGEGVSKDYLKAYMWFVIAAVRGDADSTDNRDIMRGRLTPRQRAQAEQMAARCIDTQFAACD